MSEHECIDDEPFFSDEEFEDYDDTPVVREPLIREQILIAVLGETAAKTIRLDDKDVFEAFVNRNGVWSFYVPYAVQKLLEDAEDLPKESEEQKNARLARNAVALEALKTKPANELGPIARAQLGLPPLSDVERRKRRKKMKPSVPPEPRHLKQRWYAVEPNIMDEEGDG